MSASIRIAIIFAAASAATLGAGCGGTEGPGGSAGGSGSGNTPQELIGSWYVGQGGTSAPYDPATGALGRPNGKGLLFVFEGGGRYRKAFQSYASNGGCTNGFTAHEEGRLVVSELELELQPTKGRMVVEDTCAPSLNSERPLTDLVDERFAWALDPTQTVLVLRARNGAQSELNKL